MDIVNFYYSIQPSPSLIEEIAKYLPTLTPLIAGGAALIALHSYKRQRRLHQEKLSFDFEHFYQNDPQLKGHRDNLNALYKKNRKTKIDVKTFADIDNDSDYSKSIMFVLNTWERCAHSIKEGILDEDYLFNVFHIIAIRAYENLEEYIDERRKRKGSEDVYLNFRWLVTRWKIRRILEENKELNELNTKLTYISSSIKHYSRVEELETIELKKDRKKLAHSYCSLTYKYHKKGFNAWIKYQLLKKY